MITKSEIWSLLSKKKILSGIHYFYLRLIVRITNSLYSIYWKGKNPILFTNLDSFSDNWLLYKLCLFNCKKWQFGNPDLCIHVPHFWCRDTIFLRSWTKVFLVIHIQSHIYYLKKMRVKKTCLRPKIKRIFMWRNR